MRSVFEIIGPVMVGPSSSHTAGMARIGMEAYRRFKGTLKEVRLTFSKKLEATYTGHRSDTAVLGGALGLGPDSAALKSAYILAKERGIRVSIDFFQEGEVPQNTVRVTLTGTEGTVRSVTGVSVGGGSIELLAIDNAPTEELPYCDFGQTVPGAAEPPTIAEAIRIYEAEGTPLWEQALRYEEQRSGRSREALWEKMDGQLAVMEESVRKGQGKNELLYGLTPGNDGARLLRQAKDGKSVSGGLIPVATAYAIGVMEQNASMGRLVAAPTAGSAGIVPGTLLAAAEEYGCSREAQIRALFTAAFFGVIMDARGVSFSGSVGGCQGEIGVSSALAAAALTGLFTEDASAIAHAMAMSLKNLLGLVCDPIAGPIEVPCIKRNSVGVANAYITSDMALAGIRSFIPPDEVLDALIDVEHRMPTELRCATIGGLACTETACRYRREQG